MSAVNRPEPILWITLAAIPANALLVYLLLYGAFGLPQLGLFGAGLATSIVNFGTFLAGLWFAARRRPFRKYHVLGHFWRIDWQLMRQLIVIGAPISLSFLLEYGLFGAAGLLMGVISTTALAAHQIALQVAAILFMVPFGISMAATVRVGHAIGRGDAGGVRRAGHVATWLGIVLAAVLTLAVIAGRFGIAELFLGESTDATAELSATLLLVGSTFFIADAIQTVAAGSLRGMNDTRIPLLFAILSYWLIGFACAWWLGFRTPSGAVGVWIGLSVGTAVYAVLLLLRFRAAGAQAGVPMTVREITPACRYRRAAGRRAIRRRFLRRNRGSRSRCPPRGGADDGAAAAMGRGAVEAAQYAGGAVRAEDIGRGRGRAERHDRDLSGRERNAGSADRRLQRQPSGFSRRGRRDGTRQRPASHRDDAGQDPQLARPDLSRGHHAVSPADRAGFAAAGGRLS